MLRECMYLENRKLANQQESLKNCDEIVRRGEKVLRRARPCVMGIERR